MRRGRIVSGYAVSARAKLYAYLHDIVVALVFRDIRKLVGIVTYAFPVASIFCSWSQSEGNDVGKIVFVPSFNERDMHIDRLLW